MIKIRFKVQSSNYLPQEVSVQKNRDSAELYSFAISAVVEIPQWVALYGPGLRTNLILTNLSLPLIGHLAWHQLA